MIQKYIDYIDADIEDRKQRHEHREHTYNIVFIIIISLYGMFFACLFCDALAENIAKIQHIVYVVALLGLMPTAILLSVLRALYKEEKNINESSNNVFSTAKITESIAKEIHNIEN